ERLARDAEKLGLFFHQTSTSRRLTVGHLYWLGLIKCAASFQVEPRQQCVVVEHFLEMWYQPALVDAVAMEAATELIVNPAFRHLDQRVAYHFAERLVSFARVHSEKERKHEGVGKFRSAANAAMGAVVML